MSRISSWRLILAIFSFAAMTMPTARPNFAADVAWQEIAPDGEEFFVTMPAAPQVSRGRRYVYLNHNVLVNFVVYAVVFDNTLFVVQSYEWSKPKDLINDLFWDRKKRFDFGGEIQSNGYKGKSFTRKGGAFFHSGRYFVAQNHLYVVDCANRDAPNPNMDRFLTSFAIRSTGQRPLSLPLSQTSPDRVYSGKEITRKVIVLSKLEPTYTDAARDAHVTGNVTLRANFSSSGIVTDIVVVSGLPAGLTEQAIETSKTIIFIPAEKDGKPVSQVLELTYSFNLV